MKLNNLNCLEFFRNSLTAIDTKTLKIPLQDVEELMLSSGTELHEQDGLHWPCKATEVQRSSQKSRNPDDSRTAITLCPTECLGMAK